MGLQFSETEIEVHKKQFFKSLKLMNKWLSKSTYLCGDEISIADISAACELHNINFLDINYKEYSNVIRW
jgi:glutathione S-transferase